VAHIDELKQLFVTTADGPEATPENYKSMSNQDIAPQLMIATQGGERSQELKRQISEYRELLVGFIEPGSSLESTIENVLSTEDPPVKDGVQISWESEKFEHLPLAASMALLSQIQADVRNVESDAVRYLFTKIDEGSFKFNAIEPLVVQRSDYVIQGDEYYAEIMMAARDTTQPPIVTINGTILETSEGRGILRIPANTTGEKTWTGEIAVMGPDGNYRTHTVAKVNDQRDGAIPKALLLAQLGIVADMENFEFDLQFKVTQFSVSTIRNGYVVDAASNNNLFTEEQKDLMRGTVRGQRVFIQDIQAVGPDGRTRSLGSITLLVD
jgi:gliding motility-associated protein GldM